MGSRVLRWTGYAVVVIVILTWSYVLHPAGEGRAERTLTPTRALDLPKQLLAPSSLIYNGGDGARKVNEYQLDREQMLELDVDQLLINSEKKQADKKRHSRPVIKDESVKLQRSKPVRIQRGKSHPKYIGKRDSNNRYIPDNHKKKIQNEVVNKEDDSVRFQLNQQNIPPQPKQVAMLMDSSQVEGNGRYKQVMLDQAEMKQQSRISPPVANHDDLKQIELELIKRREQVNKTCFKYGLGRHGRPGHARTLRYPPSANYDVLYIDRPDALTWCPVYKAASTTWLHLLSQLAGAKQSMLDSTKDQISTVARRLYPQLDYEEAQMAVIHTTKFMIVRHPFERLVSAYRDKLENLNIGRENGVQHFYEKYGKKIVRKYRNHSSNSSDHRPPLYLQDNPDLPPPRGVEPTFEEFVKYLIDTDLVHQSDDHWMPYYLYCTPCFLDYDVIAKFETLERDQKYLIHKLKLGNKINPKWKHLTKGQKTVDVVKKYMATISKSDIVKLGEKYKVDFEMYNYSFSKYKLYSKE